MLQETTDGENSQDACSTNKEGSCLDYNKQAWTIIERDHHGSIELQCANYFKKYKDADEACAEADFCSHCKFHKWLAETLCTSREPPPRDHRDKMCWVITKNACHDAYRKHRRQQEREVSETVLRGTSGDENAEVLDHFTSQEAPRTMKEGIINKDSIDDARAQLPSALQPYFDLYLDGMKYPGMARELKCSQSTAQSKQRRLEKALRKMKGRYYGSDP